MIGQITISDWQALIKKAPSNDWGSIKQNGIYIKILKTD
jgi:hypothetical protein